MNEIHYFVVDVLCNQCCGAGAATFRAEPEPIFFGSEPEPPVLRRLRLHLLGKQKSRAVDPDPHGYRRVNLSTKN